MIVVGIRRYDPRHLRGRDHVSHTPQLHDDALRGESRLNEAGSKFLAREYIKQFRQQRCAAAQLKTCALAPSSSRRGGPLAGITPDTSVFV